MKYLLSFFVFLFFLTQICGQSFFISGKVIDEKKSPISFATITLYEIKDSGKYVIEKIGDEKGMFVVSVAQTGKYLIKISAVGYEDFSKIIALTASSESLTFVLSEIEVGLNTVTVTANSTLITRKVDRVVMNVSNNPIAAGKTPLELFQLAPGVFVNDGEISINGVSGARVMVNNRILNLSGNELKAYLQNLSANDIQSVEVIAHPPAEYDAQGAGGLINIVLKKNTLRGLNGYLGADYSQGLGKFPGISPYINLNYNVNKWNFNANYSFSQKKSFQEMLLNRKFPGEGSYSSFTRSIYHDTVHSLRLGAVYDIAQNQYVGFSYFGSFSNSGEPETSSLTNITYVNTADNIVSKGTLPRRTKTKYSNYTINYEATTDKKGSKVSVAADYMLNNRNNYNGIINNTYNAQQQLISDTSFIMYTPSTSKIFTANASYAHNFASNIKLSFGGKFTNTNIDNTNRYDILQNNIWKEKLDLNFNFKYKENVVAGFINFEGNIKKLSYKLGVRAENTHLMGTLFGSQTANLSKKYFDWFPNIFLAQLLDNKEEHTLSLSYNRRIIRPAYFDLNPYKYLIDRYSVSMGNPELKPQYTTSAELGYLLKKKYYLGLTYSETKDVINQVVENDAAQEMMLAIKKNAGRIKSYMVYVNVPINFTKWWTANNNISYGYLHSQAPEYNLHKGYIEVQTSQNFILSKTFRASLSALYASGFALTNVHTGSIAQVNIGLQKSFFDDRLTAKANISDLFYSRWFNATAYYNNNELRFTKKEQTRVLTLSLVYNFKTGKQVKEKQIEHSNVDEKGRL